MDDLSRYEKKAYDEGDKFFEKFCERAGIMEFEGGYTKRDAERLAYIALKKQYARQT